MIDPRSTSPGSIMPTYSFLAKNKVDRDVLPDKLTVMKRLGVPYKDEEIQSSIQDSKKEGIVIANDLKTSEVSVDPESGTCGADRLFAKTWHRSEKSNQSSKQ